MNKLKFSFRAISLLAGAVLGTMAPLHSATAGTVRLDYNGPQYGGSYLSFGVAGPTNGSVSAGGFNMKVLSSNDPSISSPGSILAWCIELTQFVNTPANYTSSSGGDTWSGRLAQLFNTHYQDVLTGANASVSAAMQLAVWEIAYDSSSDLNLSNGNFRVTSGNQQARDMAQGWLNTLGTAPATGNYKIVKLTSGQSQDLVTVVPTPIPAAALLFGSALGLGGLLQRRRRAAAAVLN